VASERGAVCVTPRSVCADSGYPVWESLDAGKLGVIKGKFGDDVRYTRPMRFTRYARIH
jgi:hypothetical protein